MVQEVSTRSWGNRILDAFRGCLVGLLLLIGSFVLVYWNEGHSLHMAQALQETSQVLIRIANNPIDPQNNMKVVYFTGLATTSEVLQDPALGVSQQAIKLLRTVEMYQWDERVETKTEKQMGGSETVTKTYSYSPVWSEHLINSSQFKEAAAHQNPARMPLESRAFQAKKVRVGDFYLPPEFVNKIGGSTILDLSRLDVTPLQKKLNKPIQHEDYILYVGKTAATPEIGDLKITVSEVLPQTVTIIAQQIDKTIQPYLAGSGESVGLLVMGQQGPGQVIQQAENANRTQLWLLRILSLVLMSFGFFLLLRPIAIFADLVPFFGSLVAVGLGLLAMTGGLCLWAVATAVAWFAVRPAWAVGLVVLAVFLSIIFFVLNEKRRDEA